jgi:hypothetical protein
MRLCFLSYSSAIKASYPGQLNPVKDPGYVESQKRLKAIAIKITEYYSKSLLVNYLLAQSNLNNTPMVLKNLHYFILLIPLTHVLKINYIYPTIEIQLKLAFVPLKEQIMKTKIQLFTLFILGVFVLSSAGLFAQKTNYSGSWALNEGKSDFGDSQFKGSLKITATQDANTLSLVRLSKGRDDEDRTTSEKYALDGSESQNTGFMNSVRKSKTSWSADGKTMTINSTMAFERDGEKTEMKFSESWVLSADGKTLTIASSFTTPNGDMKQTRVYDKI